MDGYKGILEQLRNTPECRSGQFPLVLHRSTSSTRDSRTQKMGGFSTYDKNQVRALYNKKCRSLREMSATLIYY